LRADGALYYHNYDEFAQALTYLLEHRDVALALGRQGLEYVNGEYRWPRVVGKVDELLERVRAQRESARSGHYRGRQGQ